MHSRRSRSEALPSPSETSLCPPSGIASFCKFRPSCNSDPLSLPLPSWHTHPCRCTLHARCLPRIAARSTCALHALTISRTSGPSTSHRFVVEQVGRPAVSSRDQARLGWPSQQKGQGPFLPASRPTVPCGTNEADLNAVAAWARRPRREESVYDKRQPDCSGFFIVAPDTKAQSLLLLLLLTRLGMELRQGRARRNRSASGTPGSTMAHGYS